MSTAVQRRRGTTLQHQSFTGLEGELTVDTSKRTLVVHDGATIGGHPLARAGANTDITSIAGLTTPLSVAQGGTGATTTGALAATLGYPPNKNKLVNPFRVNQRGYVSGTALVQGVPSTGVGYGHDCWRAGAGGCTYTFTQLNGPTQITITAGSLISRVEGANIDQAQMVLSWAGTAQARVGVNQAEPSGAYAASPILITATVGASVTVEFSTGTVWKPQLENGSFRTPHEWGPYADVLRACQWYRPVVYTGGYTAPGMVTSAATALAVVQFPTPCRAAPTGLATTVNGYLLNAQGSGVAITGIAFNNSTVNGAILLVNTAAGLTAGNSTILSNIPALSFTGAEL